jgi:predicted Zn-dependent protease
MGHTRARRRSALALAALLLAGCSSQADRLAASLARAADHARAGQWDKASIETRNALQIDPLDARALALAGQVAEGRGDYARAWQWWTAAAERSPPGDATPRLALARLRLLTGDTDGAARALADILARQPAHAGARALQAVTQARAGDSAAAIDTLRALLADPRTASTESALLLAGLLAQGADHAGALRVIDVALVQDPGSLALLAAGAQVAQQAPATAARAIELHRRATRVAPHDFARWRAWAAFHERRGEVDDAEVVWRAGMAAADDEGREIATISLVDFLARRRGFAAARDAAQVGVDSHPRHLRLRRRLADLYDDEGRADDARRTLRALIAQAPAAPAALAARVRLAELAWAAGDAPAALGALADALRANPRDATALLLRARVLLAQGRPADAVQDLRAVVHDRPGAPEVAGLLAQALRAGGEPALARDALADAVRFKPDDPALRLLLAADMADCGETDAARRELGAAIRAAPRDAHAYDALARLALARKDPLAAEAAWRALLAANPDDVGAWQAMARLRELRQPGRGALALFEEARKAAPQRLAIAMARAGWLAREGRTEAAMAAWEALALRAPDDVAIAGSLARLLADHRTDAASLSRAQALVERFGDVDDPLRLDTLGWIQLRRGDAAGAVATLQRAARLAPDSAPTQLNLGLALHAGGQPARALPLLRKALASGLPLPHRDEAQRLLAAG